MTGRIAAALSVGIAPGPPSRLPKAQEGGPKVLFVGLGRSAVCWYRCALPATFLRRAGWDADWIGLAGEPPTMLMQTGLAQGDSEFPRFADYDVLIIQQPRGDGWAKVIRGLQSEGIKVIFEVDDYLHGIRKVEGHDYKRDFSEEELERLELNMRLCDGMICSTEYIAKRYRKFNKRRWVCRNGVDLARYDLTRPPRPSVNIGWSGATGHDAAVTPWIQAAGMVMQRWPNTCFVSIGQNYADGLTPHFGPQRCLSIPFTLIDTYPSAMTMFDIALAPAGKSGFYQGKSDLRWLEAGALGIPCVADPLVYPEIEHGVTGLHARNREEVRELVAELVYDRELRTAIGDAAQRHVREHRGMENACTQWANVLVELTSRSST